MRGVRSSTVCAATLIALLASGPAASAPAAPALVPFHAADPAEPDSTFDGFLDQLADSTSDYFGISAVPPDTAGFDSSLAYGIANPRVRRVRVRPSFYPDLKFSRVDGPVYALVAGLNGVPRLGELRAEVSYASGPNDVLWQGRWTRLFGGGDHRWRATAGGGLTTESMDRERSSVRLASVRAFLFGKDSHHYLRRKGFDLGLQRELSFAQLGIRYRDMDESAIATSAGWNLFHNPLSTFDNLPAANGRAREFEYAATVHVDPFPIQAEVIHQTSGAGIGSDFEYRRTRVAASSDIGLGQWATLVPQAVYGRLTGQAIPQAAFFLGGSRSLRSLSSGDRGGTGYALARIELIGADDVLELLRIPHPAFLPLQLGAFTGVGAVWGQDPFGGPTREGDNWPDDRHWVSEAGVSVIYQPGIPNPTSLVRLNYAWALGPAHESTRFSLSFSHALDFLRTFRN